MTCRAGPYRVHLGLQVLAGSFHTASWPLCLPAFSGYVPSSPHAHAESLLKIQPSTPLGAHAHDQAGDQWRLRVELLQALVDEGLWQSLKDALLLCGDMVSHARFGLAIGDDLNGVPCSGSFVTHNWRNA